MEESTRMPNATRVAMTLTQDWHRVPGGTAVAANALARALCETGDVSLTGVGPAGPPPGEPWNPPVDTRALRLRLPWLYEAWDRLRRPRVTSAVPDAELVHLTVPIACPPERVPMVATVHDVLPLTMPEMFTRRGVRLMRRGLERIREEAAVVMVPSNMGADEFVRQGFDRSRLAVVPLGVDPVSEPSSSSVEKALARHGLAEPYVLFVGTAEPRKGLDVLAAALGAMDRTDVTLALVGPEGWDSRDHGGSAVALGRLGDRVRRLGFVHDTDLDLLRAGAAVCCLPSRGEGFGLPVLEAMAAGAPVVTTSGTPMEEFAGGVARLVPPGDAGALAEALSEVIGDPETAEGMRGAGRERAARYSWTSSAEAVLEVYRRVLGS
jgi:glycosyltransferase involved in cell wall biosynthesis